MDIKKLKSIAENHKNIRCNVESMPSRDQNQYIIYKYDKGEIRLNSAYRPIEEAMKWATQYHITKRLSVIYMFGLGNGYFTRELMKKLPVDGRLVIIEPSYDIFSHAAIHYDLTDILKDKRTVLFLGKEGEYEFYPSLEKYVHWTNLISQIFCIHPEYDKVFCEELARYEEMIRQNNDKEIRNRNTEAHFGKKRVENTIKNIRYTSYSNVLEDIAWKIPKDIPAIIVAAGPSLDKNAKMLKAAAGRSLIIACDTALKHLYKRGIVPDVAITVDANKPETYFDMAGFEDIPVLTTATANYKVLAKNRGRKIWFSGHEYQIKLYKKLGRNLSYRTGGGSVATAAFAICASLGFQRIVLVGQDLAYEGEASHAGGEHSKIFHEKKGITYVQGIDGNEVRTRRDWVSFLQWYEAVITRYKDEIEVIDATEGGALINGTRIMTLVEVTELYCIKKIDFSHMLTGIKTIGNQEKVKKYADNMPSTIEELIKLFKEASYLAQDGIKKLEGKENGNSDIINYNVIDEIDKKLALCNQKIQKNDMYCLADEYARKETMEYVQELVNTSDNYIEDKKNHYEYTIKIQEQLIIAAENIREILTEAIAK